jgi:sigma-B regulation protein RsbU (phosphoserine phosphatase)
MATQTGLAPELARLPRLLFVCGEEQRVLRIEHLPFTIGRRGDKDLVIADARVSRDHAEIVREGEKFVLVDLGSKHGMFVNGDKVQRRPLERGDQLEFGGRGFAYLVFEPEISDTGTGAAREFLNQVSVIERRGGATSDFEKLKLFLDIVRRLSTGGVLADVFAEMIDATLRLTGAERGFIFLRDEAGGLTAAAGRDNQGRQLSAERISHSVIEEAAASNAEFVVPDSAQSSRVMGRESIVAYDLRMVICIPLRPVAGVPGAEEEERQATTIGVLYLDSHIASSTLPAISHDILRAVARETAVLVQNARMLQSEAERRRMEQEISIAAAIQQSLMASTMPQAQYFSLSARNVPCRQIGGDYFDLVMTAHGLAVVITDVSGKGISAAILAAIVQGMVHSQLIVGVPLREIASSTNRYLCERRLEKYATMFIALLQPDGGLEYLNCGHIPPVICRGNQVERLEGGSVPIGLIDNASFEPIQTKLQSGERLYLLTDGITEAEDAKGEFFGDDRLAEACRRGGLDEIFRTVNDFRGNHPLQDDCSIVEVAYRV